MKLHVRAHYNDLNYILYWVKISVFFCIYESSLYPIGFWIVTWNMPKVCYLLLGAHYIISLQKFMTAHVNYPSINIEKISLWNFSTTRDMYIYFGTYSAWMPYIWYKIFFVCNVSIWNVNSVRATAFIFYSRTNILGNVSIFWIENVTTQGGLDDRLTVGFMPKGLPFELPGTDICCPMFWNTGAGGMYILICKVSIWNVNRVRATAFIYVLRRHFDLHHIYDISDTYRRSFRVHSPQ